MQVKSAQKACDVMYNGNVQNKQWNLLKSACVDFVFRNQLEQKAEKQKKNEDSLLKEII